MCSSLMITSLDHVDVLPVFFVPLCGKSAGRIFYPCPSVCHGVLYTIFLDLVRGYVANLFHRYDIQCSTPVSVFEVVGGQRSRSHPKMLLNACVYDMTG